MPDSLPCSRCPVLDFGVVYPTNDKRDPWRRLPALFTAAKGLLGASMYRHDSQARQRIEKRISHYCTQTREAHGLCTRKRMALCEATLVDTIEGASFVEEKMQWPVFQARITRLVTDERLQSKLRATEVKAEAPELGTMPGFGL